MVYVASPINVRRARATRAEMQDREDALVEILSEIQPATVRQVYYQATVRGLVEKTEAGYSRVQRALVDLRRAGRIPYGWIADNTRMMRKPRSYDGLADLIEQTAKLYRRNLWRDADAYAEVWLEKDALSGVIYPVTSEFDVPLMVARGYSSLTFLHEAAEYMAGENRPVYVYHLGDRDPSGVDAANKIESTLRELAPGAEIHFERLAVLPEQVSAWSLPTRPTKMSDSRSRNWIGDSVELDAVHPDALRKLVRNAIERHIPHEQVKVVRVAEESEQAWLAAWGRRLAAQEAGR